MTGTQVGRLPAVAPTAALPRPTQQDTLIYPFPAHEWFGEAQSEAGWPGLASLSRQLAKKTASPHVVGTTRLQSSVFRQASCAKF